MRPASAIAILSLALAPLVLADWVVDDAAISFAYAENLAAGEGLVAVPGGERVEGYSNPLWVALLAIFALFGADLQLVAKLLASASAVATGWLAWRVDRTWLAPALLVLQAPFVIWTASGLENPLFALLLLGGLVACREERAGLAGLCFGLLALTRPEGLVYGLVAGVLLAASGVPTRRFWPVLLGLFGAHEAFRLAYFAWPLPNTYYAKLGAPLERWSWDARGWVQLRTWAWLGPGWLLPFFLLGALRHLRFAVLALLPLAFSVYAGGDWMRGFRWMSLAAAPLAVVWAAGLLQLRERWGFRAQWLAGGLVLGGLLATSTVTLGAFRARPVDHPPMIGRRLAYYDVLAERLNVPVRDRSVLDMDMGATLWWTDLPVVDLAGLVDVPIARHTFADRDFFASYVFEERRPLFAHLHRHWEKASGLTKLEGWPFVKVPPYDDAGQEHGGIWVRRDALLREWDGEPLQESLGTLELVGARIRSPQVQSELWIEVAFRGRGVAWLEVGDERFELHPTHGLLERWSGTAVTTHRVPLHRAPGPVVVRVGSGSASVELGTIEVVRDLTPHEDADLARARGSDCGDAEAAWLDLRAHGSRRLEEAATSVAACWLARGTVDDVARARHWDRHVPGYDAKAGPIADRRYREGHEAMARGDRPAAYEAFRDVLRIQPHRAWARRYAEAVRDSARR